jgi:hypothetical protein
MNNEEVVVDFSESMRGTLCCGATEFSRKR